MNRLFQLYCLELLGKYFFLLERQRCSAFMKRIKQMNIVKLSSVLGISPMVLAIVTYLTANANLVEHSQMNQMILYKEYLMNKIILLPDFKNISYLGGRQVYLLLQPYFFGYFFY